MAHSRATEFNANTRRELEISHARENVIRRSLDTDFIPYSIADSVLKHLRESATPLATPYGTSLNNSFFSYETNDRKERKIRQKAIYL